MDVGSSGSRPLPRREQEQRHTQMAMLQSTTTARTSESGTVGGKLTPRRVSVAEAEASKADAASTILAANGVEEELPPVGLADMLNFGSVH